MASNTKMKKEKRFITKPLVITLQFKKILFIFEWWSQTLKCPKSSSLFKMYNKIKVEKVGQTISNLCSKSLTIPIQFVSSWCSCLNVMTFSLYVVLCNNFYIKINHFKFCCALGASESYRWGYSTTDSDRHGGGQSSAWWEKLQVYTVNIQTRAGVWEQRTWTNHWQC